MKEQFFEPSQPGKGRFLKQWVWVFIIFSVLFCAAVWHDGYRKDKNEQAPTIGYIEGIVDKDGFLEKFDRDGNRTTTDSDKIRWKQAKEIEAWKAENAWLFVEGARDSSSMSYPVTFNQQVVEAIEELKESQLALQRRYDSLNKKFEQWKAGEE